MKSAVSQCSHSQSERLTTLGRQAQRWQALATSLREQYTVHCSEPAVTAGNTNTQVGKVTRTTQVDNVCPNPLVTFSPQFGTIDSFFNPLLQKPRTLERY